MNLIEQQMPFRRGRILAILSQSNRNGSSVPLLRTSLNGWGYKADPDTIDIDVAWLGRHGLIQQREVAGVAMLTITARGQAIVSGDLDFPGITVIEG